MPTALRVTLPASSTHSGSVGQKWWVDEPEEICENSAQGRGTLPANCGPAPGAPRKTMLSSELSCTQVCRDWTALAYDNGDPIDVLHIGDPNIASGSTYEISAIDCSCDPSNNDNYSLPLVLNSSRWGNPSGGLPSDCPRQVPNGSVDVILDCIGVLNKFSNVSCAIIKARADMEPHTPDWKITISDVLECVKAFSGLPFPYSAPVGCP